MNRQELREHILVALGEARTSPVFFSNADVHTMIQDGQEVMAESIGGILRTAYLPLKAGVGFYPLRGIAPDFMKIKRLSIPSLDRRLVAVSRRQLDEFHEFWRTVNGDPENYVSMGWDWIGVFPHPSSAGLILRVDYLAWPRTLDSDDDWPEFMDADHDALMYYGLYDGLLKRWDVEKALPVYQEFLSRLGKGKARSGVSRSQARSWRKGGQPGIPFRSGVRGE